MHLKHIIITHTHNKTSSLGYLLLLMCRDTGQPWKKTPWGPATTFNNSLSQAGLFASVRDMAGSLNLIKRQRFQSESPTSNTSGTRGNPCEIEVSYNSRGKVVESRIFTSCHVYSCAHTGRSYWHSDSCMFLVVADH